MVGELELEGIGFEPRLQRVALGLFQALELEARPQGHGQRVELVVDIAEGHASDDRARSEREEAEEERREKRSGEGQAGPGLPEPENAGPGRARPRTREPIPR